MATGYKNQMAQSVTQEQMITILASHKNLQDLIDIANKLRKNGSGGDMNYFDTFFLQAKKII